MALVTAGLLMRPAAAAASSGRVAAPGSIQQVAQPGIALHVPADGRIDGYGFVTDVTGYRFASEVGALAPARDGDPVGADRLAATRPAPSL